MSDVTSIFEAADNGDPQAAARLLPLVYQELRRLAACRLAQEAPGQTLQATALVHDAYLRLVGGQDSGAGDQDLPKWNSRGHFFAAAAEAMRRILVETARRKTRLKHGGQMQRLEIEPDELPESEISANLLALDQALDELAAHDRQAAELVKLRYFAGLTIPAAAEALGISPRKADSLWFYARAWLRREMESSP